MGRLSKAKNYLLLSGVASIALIMSVSAAEAFDYQFDNGIDVRFDNTIQYSLTQRIAPENSEVGGPTVNNGNTNDGDNAIRSGVASNRVDLLTRFDINYNGFGFDTTVDSFYDTVYNQKTQNRDGTTYNPATTPADKFTSATVAQAGRNIELRNLFVYGATEIGGIPVTVNVGRLVNLYGESLLFAGNGISYGQAPIDIERALSVPNTQAKDLFLPVGQATITAQLTTTISLSAYYQFEWDKFLLPPDGDYFAFTDINNYGGQRLIAVLPNSNPFFPRNTGGYFYRAADMSGADTGQFGGALHWNPNGTTADFGLYALQYNDSEPQIYIYPAAFPTPQRSAVGSPAALSLGTYQVVYADHIQIYGASSSITIGPTNFAGEVSVRTHEDLNSSVAVLPGQNANNSNHPLYAIGKTLHYQVSEIYLGPKTPLWNSSSVVGEAAVDSLLSIDKNSENFNRAASGHFASGVRVIASATYFQVLPGLDVSPSIGLGWNFQGHAPDTLVFNSSGIDRGGDLTLGISGVYLNEWTSGIRYTRYISPPGRDPAADRDFLSFNVERTF